MKNKLIIIIIFCIVPALLYSQQKTIAPFLQRKTSRLLTELRNAESVDVSLQKRAQDLIIELARAGAFAEIQSIRKHVPQLEIQSQQDMQSLDEENVKENVSLVIQNPAQEIEYLPEDEVEVKKTSAQVNEGNYTIDHTKDEALWEAIQDDKLEEVERLLNLSERPDINAGDHRWDFSENKTALLKAIIANSPEMVELLLSRGSNINAQDDGGHGAEWYAANYGFRQTNKKAIQKIIAQCRQDERIANKAHQQASPEIETAMEYISPGSSAARNTISNIIKDYAESNPGEVKRTREESYSPHLAKAHRLNRRIQEEKLKIELSKERLAHQLLDAIDSRNVDKVRELLDKGADYNFKIHGETSPLERASQLRDYYEEMTEIRKLLKSVQKKRENSLCIIS